MHSMACEERSTATESCQDITNTTCCHERFTLEHVLLERFDQMSTQFTTISQSIMFKTWNKVQSTEELIPWEPKREGYVTVVLLGSLIVITGPSNREARVG